MKKLGNRWIFAIVVGVLAYLIFIILSDLSKLVDAILRINIIFLILGVLVIVVGLLLKGIRWYIMLKHLGIKVSLRKCVLFYFGSLAFGLTPGRFGEVIKSYHLQKFYGVPISKTWPTIIVERVMDMSAILIILFISITISGHNRTINWTMLFVLVLFFIIIYQKNIGIRTIGILKKITKITKLTIKLEEGFLAVHNLVNKKSIVKILPLSVITWFIDSTVLYLILKSLSEDLEFFNSIFIFGMTTVAGAASFLPAGIGVTEAGLIGFMMFEGMSYDESIAPVIVLRFIVLWMPIIIGIVINRIIETMSHESQ